SGEVHSTERKRGAAMDEDFGLDRIQEDQEEKLSPAVELDADDAEASGLLDVIGRDSAELAEAAEEPEAKPREVQRQGPFVLESLYFHSFGERPLLTRDEEVAIAKRIDAGTSASRTALR